MELLQFGTKPLIYGIPICFRSMLSNVFVFAAYDGPQSYQLNNPDSSTTKVQVLNVTPDHTHTEDISDSDEDIPTVRIGEGMSELNQFMCRDLQKHPKMVIFVSSWQKLPFWVFLHTYHDTCINSKFLNATWWFIAIEWDQTQVVWTSEN